MPTRKVSPFGSWKSPISALMVSRNVELSEVSIDRETIHWIETRPEQKGRRTLVAHRPGKENEDVTSIKFDVGTRVYEYGGGGYDTLEGCVFFSNFDDMRIYELKSDSSPKAVTTNTPRYRYADLTVDEGRKGIFCIREDHDPLSSQVVNTLVTIPLETPSEGTVIASGNDFYLSPKLSPDGSTLAWITWNFPNMPWDGTELWKAKVNSDGALEGKVMIAGGPDESVIQPEWAPDGTLYFISDRTGWWNIYRFRDKRIENMYRMSAEFGEPQWRLGMSMYGLTSGRLVCAYVRDGIYHLGIIDAESKKLKTLDLPFTDLSSVHVSGETAAFIASSPTTPISVVQLELSTGDWKVLRKSSEATINSRNLSVPKHVEFPTARGLTAYAFLYAPCSEAYRGPVGEKPPLLVKVHGGPTGATAASFDLQIQFFTSRGFAVLDVNYGGSSNYGRKYRQRLNGNWGVIDVEDCANGAKFICTSDRADRKRILIRGGSAGGFTTLASLAFRRSYRAGACYYGISDLEAWAKNTHKFESRYLDKMIGKYPAKRQLYSKRSPARFAPNISAPLIIFQGLDDKVVPPSQSELMVNVMRKKKLPVKYETFEGEGHGFHMEEHISRALELELELYLETLKVTPKDAL